MNPPAPAPSVIEVLPPEGLARGRVPVAPWVVALTAGAVVAGVVLYYLVRWRRSRAAGRHDSLAPRSSRR